MGLAQQILNIRTSSKGENRNVKRQRATRESRLWTAGTQALPDLEKLVVVADRGADIFEFLAHEMQTQRNFVVRSGYVRNMLPGHAGAADVVKVHPHLRSLPAQGALEVDLAATPTRRARRAALQLSWTPLRIAAPSKPRGEHASQPLALWCVRVYEPHPPAGEAPIEWFLFTRQAVSSVAAARRIVAWYAF